MEGNSSDAFNLQWYITQLSPFGQKVLMVLHQQCYSERSRNNNNNRQESRPSVSQKILSFRDANLYRSQNYSHHTNECGNKILTFDNKAECAPYNPLVTSSPTPPTTLQLLNIETPNSENYNICCRDALIRPAASCHADNGNKKNFKNDLEKENYLRTIKSNDNEMAMAVPLDDPNITSVVPKALDMGWNNMFDTEFFQNELQDVETNSIIDNKVKGAVDSNNFQLNIKKNLFDVEEIEPESIHQNMDQESNVKSVKCKNPVKNRVLCKNKVKKSTNVKTLRKEKYTKVVENWLNDVEQTDLDTNFVYESKGQEATATVHETNKKKVIQAQLANKDGKMKFKIPNKTTERSGTDTFCVSLNKKKAEKTKERKNKTKFVAPLKSQTPVVNVTYEVVVIDESNIDEHSSMLRYESISEVIAILVYRNGFCQLNCNYTEHLCIPEGIMLYINEKFAYLKRCDGQIAQLLSELFRNSTVVCYNGKEVLIYLLQFFDAKPLAIIDVKIGGALLEPDNAPENFCALQTLVSHAPQYTIATDCALQKTAWYSVLLKECADKTRGLLIENSLWNIFVDIEMRVLPILTDMERRGVTVDMDQLKSMESVLVSQLRSVERACHEAAGAPFQIMSPVQVRAILYDQLQLDSKTNVKIRETIGTGAKSTSEAALRSLMSAHPLPKLILEYRRLHKAHATFITGIAQHVKDGVVRPSWEQAAASTGRIASNNPNLQAIPKAPFKLVMFPESEDTGGGDAPALLLRAVYRARAGRRLLAADFKHVECRVWAHAAADATLLSALATRRDLFVVLAAQWLGVREARVSAAARARTKRVVYAGLYGAGARKLADILGVGHERALAVAADFHEKFPSLKAFGRSVAERARADGRLRTLCGRARAFPRISSADAQQRALAERQAVNFVVQGTAADLCKIAMVEAEAALRSGEPPVRARLLLQIHDELVWEVAVDDVARAADIVRRAMEACGRAAGLRALPVSLAAGPDWAHLRPL